MQIPPQELFKTLDRKTSPLPFELPADWVFFCHFIDYMYFNLLEKRVCIKLKELRMSISLRELIISRRIASFSQKMADYIYHLVTTLAYYYQ